ncbi:MAG: ABC transporter ATP-binding protein [Candidatus Kapabacteria bacterium]|nr:ABC transporter ATP-binding protein [Candidatus Kapabacteria bacterium]
MISDKKVIKVENLTKRFGSFIAVNDISFEVGEGEIFGFLGANGAGKTTAIKMLTGLLLPSSGEATVAGFDAFRQSEKIKKNIGYMSQRFSLYEDLTIAENIRLYGGIYGLSNKHIKEQTNILLTKMKLIDYKNSLIASLPLGWRQKLAFAVAMFHDPKIVFLDEPTGGVDPITRRQFWDMIYEAVSEGKTIFVTTHYMDEAEYCDRVSIMVDGKIAAIDTPSKLKQQFNVKSINDVFVRLARPNMALNQ